MILGRVAGSVCVTRKLEVFEGHRVFIVQPFKGYRSLSVGSLDAGPGNTVMYATQAKLSFRLDPNAVPPMPLLQASSSRWIPALCRST